MSITVTTSATILTIYHGAPGRDGAVTSLTTTGSGAATLVSGVLNIPTPTPASIGAASQFVLEDLAALIAINVGTATGIVAGAWRFVQTSADPGSTDDKWKLSASTAATVAGVSQRPNNFDAITNAYVWFQVA